MWRRRVLFGLSADIFQKVPTRESYSSFSNITLMANSNHRISIEYLLLPNCPSFSFCQDEFASFSFPSLPQPTAKTISDDNTSYSSSSSSSSFHTSPSPPRRSSSPKWLPRDPNSNTKRKGRTTSFSHAQKTILNSHFRACESFQSYTHDQIAAIEKETCLSKIQIRNYFQNKRARSKPKAGAPH